MKKRIEISAHWVIIPWILVVCAVALIFVLKGNLLEINAIRCDNISLFAKSEDVSKLEGYYKQKYTGKREWHKINDNLWIVLYPDSKEHIFHLCNRVSKANVNGLEGDIVQRMTVSTLPDEDRAYTFSIYTSTTPQLFIPTSHKRELQLFRRQNSSSPWESLFPLFRMK